MCGVKNAVCLHGDCVVDAVNGKAYEHCRCFAMYSGSQCSFRGELLYWELSVAGVVMLLLLILSVLVVVKSMAFLRFQRATKDEFAFPRKYRSRRGQSAIGCLLRGSWSGPTRKGLPLKPATHLIENVLIIIVVLLELVQWVQVTALSFLPVVPWPAASRDVADMLRLSLLYPAWSHLEASQFPKKMLYASLGFVPGVFVLACILGVKRFPLFKPQPKSAPSEDFCTVVLRLYSDWLALPVMIGLLLPLECAVIGYSKPESTGTIPPPLNGSCFTPLQGGFVVAGIVMLVLFSVMSSVVMIQLNCEASPPEPTLWTHVRYTRAAQVLKAPLAMSAVASVNANAFLVCASSLVTSVILGVMNASMKPCVHSLVNGLRLAGAILSFWSSAVALIVTFVDDPGATIFYEAWSLGAIAISVIASSSLLLFHTEDFWHRLGFSSRESAAAGKNRPETAAKVSAIGFRSGHPRLLPDRRSSASEKTRSRAKRGLSTEGS